ncbi:MAG: hypothetical protein LBS36_13255 [Oscillospiraceae bacterium]|jgi:hypothetical protein|nr:hypothetical protein [Oscillospiraceae bacterium]
MGKRIACLLLCLLLMQFIGCENEKGISTTAPASESDTSPITSSQTTQQDLSKYEGMSDEEKLIAVGTWEKERHPANTMVFKEGGKGLITNYGITYNMTWSLEGSVLSTEVEIMKGTEQSAVYDLAMEGNAYVITSHQTKSAARFYFSGTQPTELPQSGKKDSGIFGKWSPEDSSYFAYVFTDDGSTSGKFSTKDDDQTIQAEFKWTVFDYQIYIYYVNGPQYVYEYMLSGDTLIFYQEGKPNIVYKRIG